MALSIGPCRATVRRLRQPGHRGGSERQATGRWSHACRDSASDQRSGAVSRATPRRSRMADRGVGAVNSSSVGQVGAICPGRRIRLRTSGLHDGSATPQKTSTRADGGDGRREQAGKRRPWQLERLTWGALLSRRPKRLEVPGSADQQPTQCRFGREAVLLAAERVDWAPVPETCLIVPKSPGLPGRSARSLPARKRL